jgi:chromosome segregation ATPase
VTTGNAFTKQQRKLKREEETRKFLEGKIDSLKEEIEELQEDLEESQEELEETQEDLEELQNKIMDQEDLQGRILGLETENTLLQEEIGKLKTKNKTLEASVELSGRKLNLLHQSIEQQLQVLSNHTFVWTKELEPRINVQTYQKVDQ